MNAEQIIKKLSLQKHPEGGYFNETYRANEIYTENNLPDRYIGNRNFSTSIYFLLKTNEPSMFHKILSDELWYFHLGSPIKIHLLNKEKNETIILGNDILNNEKPQCLIPKNTWFAAEVIEPENYSLVSCSVAPGFDFNDFQLAKRSDLLNAFPDYSHIIMKFTHK